MKVKHTESTLPKAHLVGGGLGTRREQEGRKEGGEAKDEIWLGADIGGGGNSKRADSYQPVDFPRMFKSLANIVSNFS